MFHGCCSWHIVGLCRSRWFGSIGLARRCRYIGWWFVRPDIACGNFRGRYQDRHDTQLHSSKVWLHTTRNDGGNVHSHLKCGQRREWMALEPMEAAYGVVSCAPVRLGGVPSGLSVALAKSLAPSATKLRAHTTLQFLHLSTSRPLSQRRYCYSHLQPLVVLRTEIFPNRHHGHQPANVRRSAHEQLPTKC